MILMFFHAFEPSREKNAMETQEKYLFFLFKENYGTRFRTRLQIDDNTIYKDYNDYKKPVN